MSNLGNHVMLRLRDDRVVAPSTSALCTVARIVLRIGQSYRLIAFGTADSHIHMTSVCDRPQAGRLARRVELAVGRQLGLDLGFSPAHIKPIEDQRHLSNAFDYNFKQQHRHGTAHDPYFDGSNLPDLLGMRINGAYTIANVRAYLPRIGPEQLLSYFGDIDLTQPFVSLQRLYEAAAAAVGRVELAGSGTDVLAAKRAAVQLASTQLSTAEISRLLNIPKRSVRRLRNEAPLKSVLTAVEYQLRLRRSREQAPTAPAPFIAA